jgi:hypothetical protein
MARGDDDIDKLLREVESTLGGPPTGPAAGRPALPAPGDGHRSAALPAGRPDGVVARVRAGVPRALAAGTGCAVVVGGAFTVVPWVLHPISGALGAFAAAVAVSLGGRVRRRR